MRRLAEKRLDKSVFERIMAGCVKQLIFDFELP